MINQSKIIEEVFEREFNIISSFEELIGKCDLPNQHLVTAIFLELRKKIEEFKTDWFNLTKGDILKVIHYSTEINLEIAMLNYELTLAHEDYKEKSEDFSRLLIANAERFIELSKQCGKQKPNNIYANFISL